MNRFTVRVFRSATALALSTLIISSGPLQSEERQLGFVDAIVASVDEKPITLSQVLKKLQPPRKLSLQEASEDPEFRHMLDSVILEELIQLEAQSRRIAVSNGELEDYLNEISRRNGLSRDEFIEALKREGRTLDEYKREVEIDILRSKLTSSLSRGAAVVSEEEIDSHLSGKPTPTQHSSLVTLRQILVTTKERSSTEARTMIEEARHKIVDEDQDFSTIAEEYSESPEAADGGLLGQIATHDLSAEIYDATYKLDEGEVSEIVETPRGYHLFLVEERVEPSDGEEEEDDSAPEATEAERNQIRESLRQAKMETKVMEFFTNELYTLHAVDKKI